MDDKLTFRTFLLPSILLCVVGWGGLALLLNFTEPFLWPHWGLYALVVMASTGTSLPISYLFNSIFSNLTAARAGVIVRESITVGIYFAMLTWLEIGRVLNFQIAVFLGLGLLVIEYLVRLYESSSRSDNVPPQSTIR